jgi:hypothetical protein
MTYFRPRALVGTTLGSPKAGNTLSMVSEVGSDIHFHLDIIRSTMTRT